MLLDFDLCFSEVFDKDLGTILSHKEVDVSDSAIVHAYTIHSKMIGTGGILPFPPTV